jgi:hypothetical protein
MIVANATQEDVAVLVDTSPKDRHVLASACAAQARVVLTRNVSDFGLTDLTRGGLVAVHPDLFLASTMSESMYMDTLVQMSAVRTRKPNTPETLHAAFAVGHHRLFNRMRHVFPGVEPHYNDETLPTLLGRGTRCMICGTPSDERPLTELLCHQCQQTHSPRE